jgi:uncharacterized protein
MSEGITVTGVGTFEVRPDKVAIELGVSVLAETADGARRQAAETTSAVIASLESSGIERSAMKTLGYSLAPEYEWTDRGRRDLGFRATNTLRVEVSEPDDAGPAIDAAVAAARDRATVSGIRFSISDPSAAAAEARSAAWADALARAEQLATLAGRELGPAVEISEVDPQTGAPPFPVARMAMEAQDASTPVEAGMETVTSRLRVRFGFAD